MSVRPRPHEVISATAETFAITRGALLGKASDNTYPRQVAAYVMRAFGHKWEPIAQAIGRDKATAIHSANVIENLLSKSSADTLEKVEQVTSRAKAICRDAVHGRKYGATPEVAERTYPGDGVMPPHKAHEEWGMSRGIREQNEAFCQAMRAAYPELEVKGGRF